MPAQSRCLLYKTNACRRRAPPAAEKAEAEAAPHTKIGSIASVFPESTYLRCAVRFYRNEVHCKITGYGTANHKEEAHGETKIEGHWE